MAETVAETANGEGETANVGQSDVSICCCGVSISGVSISGETANEDGDEGGAASDAVCAPFALL